MENYKPHSAITIVSLGRKDVVAQLPFVTISGRIPRFIKSRDLFVGKTRKQMGLNPKENDCDSLIELASIHFGLVHTFLEEFFPLRLEYYERRKVSFVFGNR
ncbi:hypothetical protein JHK87_050402 [Glycine soja]|nr:hypothetical protein JHK87_050402 [Glycine soja]